MVGQSVKNVQTAIQEKAGKFKFIQPRTSIYGIWSDVQIFLINLKIKVKSVDKEFSLSYNTYVNKRGWENLLVYKINSGKEMVICYFQT